MNRYKSGALVFQLVVLLVCTLTVHQARASRKGVPTAVDLPQFSDVTESAGIVYTVSIMTWGASWGDFNGDGYPDLYAGNHNLTPGFYLNNTDGTFTDIVESTPLSAKADRHGAAWGDFDNDGDQDLVIATGGRKGTGSIPSELHRNDGSEQFVEIAEEAGVSDPLARSRTVSWADYDRDGDLDFFSANHIRYTDLRPNRLWRNNGDGTFTDVAADAGVADSQSLFGGGFIDYDRDGWPDIFVLGFEGNSNLLYHNEGDGTFGHVSATGGVLDQGGNGYAWGDYDGDGDADLVITVSSNTVLDHVEVVDDREVHFIGAVHGDQDGFDLLVPGQELQFRLNLTSPACFDLACIHIGEEDSPPTTHPFEAGSEAYGTPVYTPGVSSGYYIWRDVDTDLWHVRWSHDPDRRIKYAGIVMAHWPITSVVPIDLEPPPAVSGNTWLWRNEGDGSFTEVTRDAGLDLPGNYRSANWVDFDNDGWLDLFVADNGTLQSGNGPNHLFRNNGDGTFEDVAALVGVTGTTEGGTNVSAWADYDPNGFLDLFVMNGGYGGGMMAGKWPFDKSSPQLFRNEGNANHWLQLELVGRTSNREGLGAVVRTTAGGRTQVQAHRDGSVARSQDGSSLHFGLGDSTVVDSIVIDWPSGIHQVLTDVPADQRLTVFEPTYVYLPLVLK